MTTHITKTWFDGEKVVTQEIPESEVYKAQGVHHAVIAGALFDFMGWLTSRPKRIMLSSADDASPAVDAIKEFAKMRGLSLDDAKVQDWQDNTTPPAAAQHQCKWPTCQSEEYQQALAEQINRELVTGAAQRQWVDLTDDEIDKTYETQVWEARRSYARAIEAKLKEKNT